METDHQGHIKASVGPIAVITYIAISAGPITSTVKKFNILPKMRAPQNCEPGCCSTLSKPLNVGMLIIMYTATKQNHCKPKEWTKTLKPLQTTRTGRKH